MSRLAAVALFVLATNAFAFDGRPVSDLRFADRSAMGSFEIATDFTDFMLLAGAVYPTRHVYTQKIVNGRPTGPQRYVGEGDPAGLAWTGTHYLGGWTKDKKLYVATISREGSLTSTPTAIDAGFFAANRNGALAFGYASRRLTVQALDFDGRPSGAVATYVAPEFAAVAVGPAAGGGFGVAFTGYFGTSLMTFRADGTPVTNAPVLIDGPYDEGTLSTNYRSGFAAVTANGSDTLVVFTGGRYDEPVNLKSVVVGANGVRKSSHVVHTQDFGTTYSMQAARAIWDGTQYLALVNVARTANGGNYDPMFVRIARSGERTGEVVWLEERLGNQIAVTLGWDGRQLIVPAFENFNAVGTHSSFCLAVDPLTLTAGPRVFYDSTLDGQTGLTIAAGHGEYLAAWFETTAEKVTVRASRIDREGNYLDGAGIVLDTVRPRRPYETPTISIDGNGPQWFVAWTDVGIVGRTVSRGGVPGAGPFAIGDGDEAAVRWRGTEWVVLHAGRSLKSNTVSTSGAIGPTQTLLEGVDGPAFYVYYRKPSLVLLANRLLAVFAAEKGSCAMQGCFSAPSATGLLLDTPGAVPFTIEEEMWGDISVAAGETTALVTWSAYQGVRGAFLPAGSPEQFGTPFIIDPVGTPSAAAFDGSDFVVAWVKSGKVAIEKIAPNGAVGVRQELLLDNIEFATQPVLAASATMPVLAGFTAHLAKYDFVPRGAIVFPAETGDEAAVPPALSILCATDNGDGTIRVRWNRVDGVLGIAIELALADGTFRTIGVAPSHATSALVAKSQLNGSGVRIRAWNSAGVSAPSAIATSSPAPEAILPSSANACAGVPIEITATLRGNPPFTVRWSDGERSHVNGSTVTRPIAFASDAMLSIVSVTDASCEPGGASASMRVRVSATPSIDDQSRTVRVSRGQTAALHVTTRVEDVRFAWFAGARGDTSHPVGGNSAAFTTPSVKQTSQYWVRLTTSCGTIDSDAMTVVVNGKRRSVR